MMFARTRRAKASGPWTVLVVLGHTQEQEGDEDDGDLDAYGVLGGAEEMADFQGLLDPAEEQFDRPASLVRQRITVGMVAPCAYGGEKTLLVPGYVRFRAPD